MIHSKDNPMPINLLEQRVRQLLSIERLDTVTTYDDEIRASFRDGSGAEVAEVSIRIDLFPQPRHVAIVTTSRTLPVRGWREVVYAYARARELLLELETLGYTDGGSDV